MRVLIYDPFSNYINLIALPLIAGGCDVHCVSHRATPPNPVPGLASLEHVPLPVPQGGQSLLARLRTRSARRKNSQQRAEHLREVLAPLKSDAVIAIDVEIGLPVALAAAATVPVFSLSLGSDVMVVPKRVPRLAETIRRNIQSSGGVIVFSGVHEKSVRDVLGTAPLLHPGFIFTLPLSRDVEFFSPNETPRQDASHLPPMILATRGVAHHYRPEALLTAAAIAHRSTPLRLRFLATPESESRLRAHAEAAGLPRAVLEMVTQRFPFSQMPHHYAEATVVAQSLLGESMGYTGMETQACGRVLVQPLSDITLESVNSAQRHLLSGPSPEAMAERLVYALTHADERKVLEASNREFALKRFDERHVVPETGKALRVWMEAARK